MSRNFLIFTLLLSCLLPRTAMASETDGTIDATAKYAWGESIGWVNFGTAEGNVHVTDDGLTGDAWSDNYGWIRLDVAPISAVTNDGEGVLGGHAWSETLGWIEFDGVTIGDDGSFSGYATVSIDGSQISFNCDNTDSCADSNFSVASDWRKVSVRESGGEGDDDDGGGSGGGGGARRVPSRGTPEVEPVAEPEPEQALIQPADTYGILEFNIMMVRWGDISCGNTADMNADCLIDVLDFNVLMVNWGLPTSV